MQDPLFRLGPYISVRLPEALCVTVGLDCWSFPMFQKALVKLEILQLH